MPLPPWAAAHRPEVSGEPDATLPGRLLLRNVFWFCRLRWLVVVALAVFGVVGLLPEVSAALGWRPHPLWPFIAAGVLALYNSLFLLHARRLARGSADRLRSAANLWGQTALDLGALVVVVHFTGSIETPMPFAFLFHIVLGCIFLSRRQSLGVTLAAVFLYVGCVALETTGVLGREGIYADRSLRLHMEATPGAVALQVFITVAFWLVAWYLASHLAGMVRQRDRVLAATNRRLLAAQEERTRHMLRTTHELKAPFAAIHANTQLLLKGHCGVLSDEALEVIRRIGARCERLAHEIQEMLQLANLRSKSEEPPQRREVDLAEVLGWCIGQVLPRAQAREVALESDLQPAPVFTVEDHAKMLFNNVLANAVAYSHRGGTVRVACRPERRGAALVTIADRGIGIHPEKLPRIFEEYYRTDEAARHNRASSGLGLAIVRHIARTHGIQVTVESQVGAGTTFRLRFPPRSVPGGTPPGQGGK